MDIFYLENRLKINSFDKILSLTDGSGLKITIEEYQTPNKNKIHKVGIKPDVEIELTDSKEDVQLQKAIELLK